MATYSLPNSADCCESDGTLKCPDTPCGKCTNCTPLYCVTIPPYPTLYNTVLATDINGNPAMGGPPDSQECLHIPYQMGTPPPTDRWVDSPNVSASLESIFTPGSSFDCDPNYCENNPYDPDCSCHPEEDFKWNGQESVVISRYGWDYMVTGDHYLDYTFTLPWDKELCGYISDTDEWPSVNYFLYYTELTGWVLESGITWQLPYQNPNNNIFTYVGRDPSISDYYEIS